MKTTMKRPSASVMRGLIAIQPAIANMLEPPVDSELQSLTDDVWCDVEDAMHWLDALIAEFKAADEAGRWRNCK